MKVNVDWLNEDQTVIHYRFEPYWTMDDYLDAVRRSHELRQTVPHKVALIYDFSPARGHFPVDAARRLPDLQAINTGASKAPLIIALTPNPIFQILARLYFRKRSDQVALSVPTWAEAFALLEREGYLKPEVRQDLARQFT